MANAMIYSTDRCLLRYYGEPYYIELILLVKVAKYIGFCVYRRSYLIWSPVIEAANLGQTCRWD